MGELGWSPQQFWLSPLPDFFAAWRGYQRKQRDKYWHTGEVIAALYNVNRDSQKHPEPYGAIDIFPWLLTEKEKVERKWADINRRLISEPEDHLEDQE